MVESLITIQVKRPEVEGAESVAESREAEKCSERNFFSVFLVI